MNFKKAQSAMEYLMTYGWAILVVLIVIAALFYLGVFDSKSDIKQGVEGPFTYDLKVGNNGLQISLKTPSVIKSATVESITVTGSDNVAVDCTPDNSQLSGGSTTLITCNNGNIDLSTGESANVVIGLTYTQQNSQLPHTINIVKKGIAEEVTFNAAMVNGACGTANGKSYSTTPVDNPPDNQLCLTGDASSVTANNPILKWEWTCNGRNGGTNANCNANIISALNLNSNIVALYHLDSYSSMWVEETDRYNGISYQGTTLTPAGKINSAANFDGTDDYIFANSPTVFPGLTNTGFTISAWIYSTQNENQQGLVGEGYYAGAWDFDLSFSVPQFKWRNSAGTAFTCDSSSSISMNAWHFLVVTYDGNNVIMYVDGNIVPKCTTSYAAKDFKHLGGLYFAKNELAIFGGKIDEVMMLNRPLTTGEITTLYTEQNSGRAYYYP